LTYLISYAEYYNDIRNINEFSVSYRSVREMVDQYQKLGYPLHVLVNNAAIQAPKGHRGEHTKDGIEVRI
jgi:NAD(P)-dependent dehydrogenase (short-subunit alcohol dehydrogenase family)